MWLLGAKLQRAVLFFGKLLSTPGSRAPATLQMDSFFSMSELDYAETILTPAIATPQLLTFAITKLLQLPSYTCNEHPQYLIAGVRCTCSLVHCSSSASGSFVNLQDKLHVPQNSLIILPWSLHCIPYSTSLLEITCSKFPKIRQSHVMEANEQLSLFNVVSLNLLGHKMNWNWMH